jgi:hypothetical protein
MLPSQKYKNTSRTITGTGNLVFDNDVLIFCNTSVGAVELTLLEIPANYWNTIYTLRVIDVSGNASVNNITINAPSGYTINGASSAVININNGVAIITIASNTNYCAVFTFNTFAQGLTVLTASTLSSLISANNLIAGAFYLITDAIFINTSGIYSEAVPILVQAISTNEITLNGNGIFLNADYQGTGDYSSVTGFVAQRGVWDGLNTYVVGDVVIWNNLHWVNLTGTTTLVAPNLDTTNWQLLVKSSTKGYITEIDIIKYNVETNKITYREDVRNNRIENNLQTYIGVLNEAFLCFQWGNINVVENTVLNESFIECWNNILRVNGNIVNNASRITFTKSNNGKFNSNTFDSAIIIVSNNLGDIIFNEFKNTTTAIGLLSNASFISNIVVGGNLNSFDVLATGKVQNNQFITDTDAPAGWAYIMNGINSTMTSNNFYNSFVSFSAISGNFSYNTFNKSECRFSSNNSSFVSNNWNEVNFRLSGNIVVEVDGTILHKATSIGVTLVTKIAGGIIQNNVGTTIQPLDLTDPTIYDSANGILTIPNQWRNLIGEFWLFGAVDTLTIRKIVGLENRWATKFINKELDSNVNFEANNDVTTATATEIISNLTPPTFFSLRGRTNGEDSIYIRSLGNLNGVEQVYIYQ